MEFVKLEKSAVSEMSEMATEIVREHYDPIIGKEQNDYMLKMFQSEDAILSQLAHGYNYYFVKENGKNVGFIAFYRRDDAIYLSKLYLYKTERKKGYSRMMIDFVKEAAKKEGLGAIELNVNKKNDAVKVYEALGFKVVRLEKNDIGNGFYMDDYVFRLDF